MSETDLIEYNGCHCDNCVNVVWTELQDLKQAYQKLDEEKLSLEWEVGELKSELKELKRDGKFTEGR